MSKIQFEYQGHPYEADLGRYSLSYGGMATPFGIRIHSAITHAGVSNLQMVCTGLIYAVAVFAAHYLSGYLQVSSHLKLDTEVASWIGLVIYLLFFRLTPLASIHASEHQVIHAMEKSGELTFENVSRQNRVHPRCGTNFMALLVVFGALVHLIQFTHLPEWIQFPMLVCALMTSSFASPRFGGFLQKYFTTKAARDSDIQKAIDVAMKHNSNFIEYLSKNDVPSALKLFFMSISNSGAVYIFSAYLATYLALNALFTIPIP